MPGKIIACEVFQCELLHCLAQCSYDWDYELVEAAGHLNCLALRTKLQGLINQSEQNRPDYDAILLLFGLCGNATVGLSTQRCQLVIPRAHDCATILLGSQANYQKYFQKYPSAPYSSSGWSKYTNCLSIGGFSSLSLAGLTEHYGIEHAQYLWQQFHPQRQDQTPYPAYFIEFAELPCPTSYNIFQKQMTANGYQPQLITGDFSLIRKLIEKKWKHNEVLVLAPGEQIAAVYDTNEVIYNRPPQP